MSHQKLEGKKSTPKYCRGIIVEALRRSLMDFQLSCTSHLPWIWVVETLAHSSQVDISLLLDLLEKTPEISDDLGRNAREVVSLKILERLSVLGTPANPVSSASSEKMKLDPSDSCEDVLQRIVAEKCQQTSPSCLKPADLDMAKWDLQPFIQHKRSSLAIYTLKQLKDAILTGKNSFLASLKEQSGLPVGDLPSENLLSVNRKRKVGNESTGGTSYENQIVADNGSVKKHKDDAICSDQFVGCKVISSGVDTQLADTSAACVEHNEGERCNLGRMIHVGDTRINEPQGADNDECTSPKGFIGRGEGLHPEKEREHEYDTEKSKGETREAVSISSDRAGSKDDDTDFAAKNDASLDHQHSLNSLETRSPADHNNECTSLEGFGGHDEALPHEDLAPRRDTDMPNDKFDGEQMQDHEVGLDKFEQNVLRNAPSVGEAEEGVNMSSDSDGFHDELASIDAMKKAFLSSQCMYSQDSLATAGCRELKFCMKCHKGGELLVCSSDSCPIVIHSSCLGSDATYDTSGKFYCLFCACSQSISKYKKIERKTSLARKDLATFICVGTQKESEERSRRLCRKKQNFQEPDDGLLRSNKMKRDSAQQVCNLQQRKELGNEQAGLSELTPGGKATASTNIIDHGLNKDKQGKRTTKVSRSQKVQGKQQANEQIIHKPWEKNTSCRVSETRDTCENHSDVRSEKGALCPSETDLPHEQNHSSNSQSVDLEETSEEENKSESSGASRLRTRVRKQKMKYSYPAIPLLRRKKLPWTIAEENALKEGIRLLSNPRDKFMPWTKILEFGAGVFEKSRTTIDLKDKWRNMCKAAQKS